MSEPNIPPKKETVEAKLGTLTFKKSPETHITLKKNDASAPCVDECKDKPCVTVCPAKVYEQIMDDTGPRIQINFSNCVHCKTCVIADPCEAADGDHLQNIDWRAPAEGGPAYKNL